MIWSGFLIGLIGSWHCIGMCGPIALMVPGAKGKSRFVSILLYHSGKTMAYLSIGSLIGLIPALLTSFKIQATITITAGIVILLFGLIPFLANLLERKGFVVFSSYFNLKNRLAAALDKNKLEYGFYIGFLNGFIPCGMVYVAALGAISQAGFMESLGYMFLFSLGTLPLMSAFMFTAGFFKNGLQKYAGKLRTAAFVLVGIFMIYKGFVNLNKSFEQEKIGDHFLICSSTTDPSGTRY